MKLKRYNDYVNEDLQPMIDQEEEILTPDMDGDMDNEMDNSEIIDDENDLIDSDEETYIGNNMDEEEGEEEGYEYKGTMLMKELANRLGEKVVNNSIEHNGKKINYFSETEAFHVDKMKFETVDEVVDYLTK